MMKLILASAILFATSISSADTNFEQLVQILAKTQKIADCQIALSSHDSKMHELRVTQNSKAFGFTLSSPDGTGGRIFVKFEPATKTYRYAQSDIIGWVHLDVTLGSDETPVALKMTKTFPDGRVYDTGADCK